MENGIKRQMTDADLATFVQQAFDGSRTLISANELKDGWFNSAYVLTLDNGMKAVLKVAPHHSGGILRYERGMMKAEVEVLRILQNAGKIPVPEVYYYNNLAADPEYFVMEHLAGQPFNKVKDQLPAAEREQIERELGEISRRINKITGQHFGYYAIPEKHGTCWRKVFTGMISDLIADARDANLPLPAEDEEILALLDRHRAALEEVATPYLVHWDLWDGNVFVDDGKIIGIIDCERALWGDPLMEYYFRGIWERSQPFMEGYGLQSLTESELERIKLYDLYLALIFYIECSYRKYSDRNHIQWATDTLWQCWQKMN
ncbi:Phosphotransferase enzyme family protein [compost metagenome]